MKIGYSRWRSDSSLVLVSPQCFCKECGLQLSSRRHCDVWTIKNAFRFAPCLLHQATSYKLQQQARLLTGSSLFFFKGQGEADWMEIVIACVHVFIIKMDSRKSGGCIGKNPRLLQLLKLLLNPVSSGAVLAVLYLFYWWREETTWLFHDYEAEVLRNVGSTCSCKWRVSEKSTSASYKDTSYPRKHRWLPSWWSGPFWKGLLVALQIYLTYRDAIPLREDLPKSSVVRGVVSRKRNVATQ